MTAFGHVLDAGPVLAGGTGGGELLAALGDLVESFQDENRRSPPTS